MPSRSSLALMSFRIWLLTCHAAHSLTSPQPTFHRRTFLNTLKIVIPATINIIPQKAPAITPGDGATTDNSETTTNTDSIIFLRSIVSLPPDYSSPETPPSSPTDQNNGSSTSTPPPPLPALYVTCRPDRPDNVPAAILNGSRGKPPPVLAARFSNPSFPFSFSLTSQDMTMEGTPPPNGSGDLWWKGDNLIVSVRLDRDGVAATRSPDDLVGRGVFSGANNNGGKDVEIVLSGRGAFGRFATGGGSGRK